MPAPAPYRIYDPRRREVMHHCYLLTEEQAREEATRLLAEDGESATLEIQHLEDGLLAYEYYRIAVIEAEAGGNEFTGLVCEICGQWIDGPDLDEAREWSDDPGPTGREGFVHGRCYDADAEAGATRAAGRTE